jgi:hypothetical protein
MCQYPTDEIAAALVSEFNMTPDAAMALVTKVQAELA